MMKLKLRPRAAWTHVRCAVVNCNARSIGYLQTTINNNTDHAPLCAAHAQLVFWPNMRACVMPQPACDCGWAGEPIIVRQRLVCADCGNHNLV